MTSEHVYPEVDEEDDGGHEPSIRIFVLVTEERIIATCIGEVRSGGQTTYTLSYPFLMETFQGNDGRSHMILLDYAKHAAEKVIEVRDRDVITSFAADAKITVLYDATVEYHVRTEAAASRELEKNTKIMRDAAAKVETKEEMTEEEAALFHMASPSGMIH